MSWPSWRPAPRVCFRQTNPKRTEPPGTGARIGLFLTGLFITAAVTALVLVLAAVLLPLFVVLFALLALTAIIFAFAKGGCLIGFLTLLAVGALITFGEWLGQDGVIAAITIPLDILGLVFTIAMAIGDTEETLLPATHHGRYVRAEDLDEESQQLLLRVQQVRAEVVEAAEELGQVFDSARTNLLLRDQEWQLARVLREQDRLSKDLEGRGPSRPSPRPCWTRCDPSSTPSRPPVMPSNSAWR